MQYLKYFFIPIKFKSALTKISNFIDENQKENISKPKKKHKKFKLIIELGQICSEIERMIILKFFPNWKNVDFMKIHLSKIEEIIDEYGTEFKLSNEALNKMKINVKLLFPDSQVLKNYELSIMRIVEIRNNIAHPSSIFTALMNQKDEILSEHDEKTLLYDSEKIEELYNKIKNIYI